MAAAQPEFIYYSPQLTPTYITPDYAITLNIEPRACLLTFKYTFLFWELVLYKTAYE